MPLAGQTAILNIGIAVLVNGVLTTFFNASQLPANLSELRPVHPPGRGDRR